MYMYTDTCRYPCTVLGWLAYLAYINQTQATSRVTHKMCCLRFDFDNIPLESVCKICPFFLPVFTTGRKPKHRLLHATAATVSVVFT